MMRISLLAMDGFRMDGLTFSSCFYLHSQAKKSGEDEKLYDRKRERERKKRQLGEKIITQKETTLWMVVVVKT
jgi:hypothetical protein